MAVVDCSPPSPSNTMARRIAARSVLLPYPLDPRKRMRHLVKLLAVSLLLSPALFAQAAPKPAKKRARVRFSPGMLDKSIDPCTDFYACCWCLVARVVSQELAIEIHCHPERSEGPMHFVSRIDPLAFPPDDGRSLLTNLPDTPATRNQQRETAFSAPQSQIPTPATKSAAHLPRSSHNASPSHGRTSPWLPARVPLA